ncbi:CMRF35-like molecule 3, partial [Silurus meridionalis]
VTGYRGRSVQFKCPYESGYEKNNKYLCRGECPPWPANKDVPVQSGSPAEDTRFSLYDDTTAKIFTVTITDLRAEDANTYWCGIQRFVPFRDIYTKLQLLVEMAGSDDVTTVTGYRGRSVQIKCHYESGYEKNNKYLCRGECPHWPATKEIPVQSGSPAEDTRFSLYDDTTAKIFTITITDLRAEDANTYWCVVQQTRPNIYTELQLLVEMAGSDAVTTVTGYRGRSVQIKCPYEPGYEEYKKYLCRGDCSWKHVLIYSGSPAEDTRFSLYDNTKAKIFTIDITDLREEDEGTYWCGIERMWPTIDIYTELHLLV